MRTSCFKRAQQQYVLCPIGRIHLRFFRAFGLVSGRSSFASSRTAMSDRFRVSQKKGVAIFSSILPVADVFAGEVQQDAEKVCQPLNRATGTPSATGATRTALILSVSPFPSISRVSHGYPAGGGSSCTRQASHRSSAMPKWFFLSLLAPVDALQTFLHIYS